MEIPLNMPQVGLDIPTGRMIEWLKREGDPIKNGEVVAMVESDKAIFEVQADTPGILFKILVAEGQDGEVFEPIALIGSAEEPVNAPVTPAPEASEEMASTSVASAHRTNETRTAVGSGKARAWALSRIGRFRSPVALGCASG